jgi:hypothetical protein
MPNRPPCHGYVIADRNGLPVSTARNLSVRDGIKNLFCVRLKAWPLRKLARRRDVVRPE